MLFLDEYCPETSLLPGHLRSMNIEIQIHGSFGSSDVQLDAQA